MDAAEYLSKTEMLPTAVKLMEQLATWDNLEGTWEVVIPVTPTVSAQVVEGDDWFNAQFQLASWLEQNGLDFSTVNFEDGVLTLSGVRLAS
jgi:hypothetical protein